MCRKRNDDSPRREWPTVRDVFLFVSVVFVLFFIFLVVWQVRDKIPPVQQVVVSLQMPVDSTGIDVNRILAENESQIKELVASLEQQNHAIQEKHELLIKSRETEHSFIRLISAIVAFIVALIGFLGYKTVRDIEERVEISAKNKADETVKKIMEEQMNVTVENKLNKMVSGSVVAALIKNQMMDRITNEISKPLERRIDSLKEQLSSLARRSSQHEERTSIDLPAEDPTPAPQFDVAIEEKEGGKHD